METLRMRAPQRRGSRCGSGQLDPDGWLDRKVQDTFALPGPAGALQDIGKGGGIEDSCGRIANVLHQEANAAGLFIAALLALFVRGLADTGQRSERSFEHPQHKSNRQEIRGLAQGIAAAFAFLAAQDSVVFEFQQDQFEKSLGYMLALSNLGDEHRPIAVFLAQNQQRLQRIFGFM